MFLPEEPDWKNDLGWRTQWICKRRETNREPVERYHGEVKMISGGSTFRPDSKILGKGTFIKVIIYTSSSMLDRVCLLSSSKRDYEYVIYPHEDSMIIHPILVKEDMETISRWRKFGQYLISSDVYQDKPSRTTDGAMPWGTSWGFRKTSYTLWRYDYFTRSYW